MIILVNSKINSSNIQSSLGKPEYSYYFLLAQLIPAMEQFARVIELESPEEVDATYRKLSATGESVVFISASPPHLTPLDLQCPTVSLFAWEFPDAPDQPWDNNPCNDWRHPLKHLAGAIASSWESAQAVRNLDGHSCPVTSVPAAVWPHFGDLLPEGGWRPAATQRHFEFSGFVLDSHVLGLSANGLVQHAPRSPRYTRVNSAGKDKRGAIGQTLDIFRSWRAAIRNRKSKADAALPAGEVPPPNPAGTQPVANCRFELSGVVFCTVLSPKDGRKNWDDIVTAFCWAFRDNPDATLILKITHHDLELYRIFLLTLLSRLAPFRCRVLTLHGFLDDQQYRELISVSDFYVNASTCEGLCLPLMEFLSAGKPALAPRHTAMLDYLDENIAHVVDTAEELADWPHDPTGELRSRRHRLNWESLMLGFQTCERMARQEPDRYQRMSMNASQHMRRFCDTPVVARQLEDFLTPLLTPRHAGGAQ
ncbi:glycosyltransferase [Halopseudomonas formosensis]|uniref:Glycosyltransferase n=1 Tax=Halopseudomonas formosensis TaxID=1002526 RepID=A0ABU5C0B6_9GAMM|nr:glycosyltransferase [Halopseudomonas formosensis]MDX9688376.1 glycosyltransferase [Halopseudomonas formosensis]